MSASERRVTGGVAGALILLASCGGPPPPARPEAEDAGRWTDQAAEAWRALEPERAATLAERALRLDPGDAAAREIAARSLLTRGRFERAVRVLEGVSEPVLLRLRARAQIGLARFDDALASLDAARRHAREADPWAESVRGALRAGEDAFAIEGAREAMLPLEPLPLPVVRVRADTVETLALIGTGADFAVLDPSVRAASGALDELALGAMRVRAVPYVTRSLAPVREALGADVRMVIGMQLLMRLHATLDGPESRLTLRADAPRDGEIASPVLTPTGAFMVVPARVGEARAWMTVDTAGLFPVALTPGAELGLTGWREVEGERAIAIVPALRIGDLIVEEVPAVRGLLGEAYARSVGAPVAGSLGWMLLGQTAIRFDPAGRRIFFE